MPKQFLEAGKIVGMHGVNGDMRVECWCNSPEFMCRLPRLYLNNGHIQMDVEKIRPHKNIVLLKLKNINDATSVLCLKNEIIWLNRDDVKLEEGEHFIQDLIGMDVIDADDKNINYGKITEVSATGANDVYHIKNKNNKEYLLPAIKDVIIETDIDNNVMVIRPLKGIFDDEN